MGTLHINQFSGFQLFRKNRLKAPGNGGKDPGNFVIVSPGMAR
jgi:hypothetical protein